MPLRVRTVQTLKGRINKKPTFIAFGYYLDGALNDSKGLFCRVVDLVKNTVV